MRDVTFRPVVAADEELVRGWLQLYLEQHVAWWLAARGLEGEPAEVVARRGLVTRDWTAILADAGGDPGEHLVEIAELAARPAGLVRAAVRPDRYLGVRGGVLEWLAVDPAHRGRGLAAVLVQRASAWFDASGVEGAELFVTNENAAAMRAYARAGFRPVDTRMFRPAAAGRSLASANR